MKNIFAKYAPTTLITSILLLLYICFEREIIENFDRFIIPVFSIMRFNIITKILFCIIISIFLFSFFRFKWYKGNEKAYWFSFVIILMYGYYCWYEKLYAPILFFCFVGYTDVLIGILIFTLFYKLISSIFKKKKNEEIDDKDTIFLSDTPIISDKKDILDYANDVKQLAEQLKIISSEYSYSVGITSSWGSGKSSYLNMLKNYLSSNKDFIVIDFNPRHSYTPQDIQKDFFSVLQSKLKEYDYRFTYIFKNYLKALSIIESKFLSSLFELHKIWDVKSEKEKLNDLISQIDKRIVIVIEDFDRLLADEIIEVFKLIDGNASFTNFIFITAYDKKHINKIIGETYSNEEAFFSDKFFTIEVPIPKRPYDKIFNYLIETLTDKLHIRKEEVEKYEIVLANHIEVLKKYLTTLRDVKRFLNLFIRSYQQVEGEVEFRDYFLIRIIQYKNEEEYVKLYKKEYFENEYFTEFKLKENLNAETKEIIRELFNKDKSLTSINNHTMFDRYFYNSVYGTLKITEMEKLLDEETTIEDVYSQIKSYSQEVIHKDLVPFLEFKNILQFNSKSKLERYLDIIVYIYCSTKNRGVYLVLLSFIYKKTKNEILRLYKDINQDYYYDWLILSKLQGSYIKNMKYPNYPNLTGSIISESITNQTFRESIIFTKEKLLDISKKALDDLLANDEQVKQLHLELLYSCFSEIKDNVRVLDEEYCKKIYEAIKKEPKCFLNEFVTPLVNGVRAPLFWEDLFKNKEELKKLIDKTDFENKFLVRNFWKLFENNEYKPIEILDKPFTQMVNDNLEREIKRLKEIEQIKKEFCIKKNERETNKQGKSNQFYKGVYMELLNKLKNIDLNITMKDAVKKLIEKEISECDKEAN
ncbi:P-loop NTPase fold protein [Capnocytophaga sputigena]|uniref:KAP family P-loop NTPase fold protein n=1 Tax=Capnocytophaga sputigena TaxID=1019 RepID=UPI0028E9FBA2|nr:P-loop NTPase fold protein [Capnocytophaga sputigena]